MSHSAEWDSLSWWEMAGWGSAAKPAEKMQFWQGWRLVSYLMRVRLGYRHLGLRPVVLWSVLLQPGEKGASVVSEDPWPLVLKPSFPPPPKTCLTRPSQATLMSAVSQPCGSASSSGRTSSSSMTGTARAPLATQSCSKVRARQGLSAQAQPDVSLYPLRQSKGFSLASGYHVSNCTAKRCPQHRPSPHPFCDLAGP